MTTKATKTKKPAEQVVKDIRRTTRRHFSDEDKIRIVLDGLRGEDSIAELCRREGIAQSLYYTWSKEFMEAGRRRLAGDTAREARDQGFDGAACVHPTVVPILNAEFSPSPIQRAWAERVVAAVRNGEGACQIDGRMVDAPVIARALSPLSRG